MNPNYKKFLKKWYIITSRSHAFTNSASIMPLKWFQDMQKMAFIFSLRLLFPCYFERPGWHGSRAIRLTGLCAQSLWASVDPCGARSSSYELASERSDGRQTELLIWDCVQQVTRNYKVWYCTHQFIISCWNKKFCKVYTVAENDATNRIRKGP